MTIIFYQYYCERVSAKEREREREREEDGQTRGAAITDIARDINEFHGMPQK